MKTMKKTAIYILLLVLAACAADVVQEPESPIDYDGAKIVVMGGSAAPGGTRADGFPEPSNFGVCNADKIKILQYKASKNKSIFTVGELEQDNLVVNIDNDYKNQSDFDLINQLNYRDKWTNLSIYLTFPGNYYYTGYAFPAIAYTKKEANAFELINTSTYTALTLKLKDAGYTPELYFGRLKPANDDYTYSDKEGFTYNYNRSSSVIYDYKSQLEGKLYRIVSQLNINISDINDNVKKLEMFLSNVPIRVGLYENHRTDITQTGTWKDHGYFYPITTPSDISATTKDHCMTPTSVCSVEEFNEGKARLSTFLLPSTQGRTVTIEATIRKPYLVKDPNTANNTNGEKYITEYKDTVISRTLRAGKNYNLDLATSRVYYSETELPVYKAATNEFMSYSNVRVNVSGKFSDIFSEQSESNIVIEICPNYEGQHSIEIN